jgi:nucleoside-diphosphate-sugar epimerase
MPLRAAPRQRAAMVAHATPKKVLMMGGTRFIGLYLARQLVEAGHEVTLFTRGKSDVCPQIPDDTPDFYANFAKCAAPPCWCEIPAQGDK